jgi:uncharacterized membrane protein
MVHHRLFNHIAQADEVLMYLNLLFLMFIAALPFPTAVLGLYGGHTSAVVLYATNMAVAGALLTGLTFVVQRRHLLSSDGSGDGIRQGMWRGATTSAVFALSIPLAFVNPNKAPFFWLITLVVRFIPSDAKRRARAAKKAAHRAPPPAETGVVSPPGRGESG